MPPRVLPAGLAGAVGALPSLRHRLVDRHDYRVSRLLELDPPRRDLVARGVALHQWLPASRLDRTQRVFPGSSFLDHSKSYGSNLDVRLAQPRYYCVEAQSDPPKFPYQASVNSFTQTNGRRVAGEAGGQNRASK